jgi:hypothetical protein
MSGFTMAPIVGQGSCFPIPLVSKGLCLLANLVTAVCGVPLI